ncbi:TetR family transcriptional regulator [Frondihabitans sucicola]|uniref:TetR family transcriptional regulator n=1 Tax=Frondihabitans sucicola TaxID=1268041 RepID=A0ABN6XZ73_9MICO|nr:TetR/AcrR family transcriptional regulator C-terminal domain-containing protein [Frondihabitans sucicola]BDZ50231.1 TetR family transcriptional regulator [Frondihabitans sucicola]
MVKINRDVVIGEALELLDEVGLDAVSTRRLAQRLGVEQPSLYWHFRKKSDLLSGMAQAAMLGHAEAPLPDDSDEWQAWFVENYRSFRLTLLHHRDGARLHAGLLPGQADYERILLKQAFLVASGVPVRDAQMAMLAASRFTVGSVLEEQADPESDLGERAAVELGAPRIDHESAFEDGLRLIVEGLRARVEKEPG